MLFRSSSDERGAVDEVVRMAVEAIVCWLHDGIDLAMTRYNVNRLLTNEDES